MNKEIIFAIAILFAFASCKKDKRPIPCPKVLTSETIQLDEKSQQIADAYKNISGLVFTTSSNSPTDSIVLNLVEKKERIVTSYPYDYYCDSTTQLIVALVFDQYVYKSARGGDSIKLRFIPRIENEWPFGRPNYGITGYVNIEDDKYVFAPSTMGSVHVSAWMEWGRGELSQRLIINPWTSNGNASYESIDFFDQIKINYLSFEDVYKRSITYFDDTTIEYFYSETLGLVAFKTREDIYWILKRRF